MFAGATVNDAAADFVHPGDHMTEAAAFPQRHVRFDPPASTDFDDAELGVRTSAQISALHSMIINW